MASSKDPPSSDPPVKRSRGRPPKFKNAPEPESNDLNGGVPIGYSSESDTSDDSVNGNQERDRRPSKRVKIEIDSGTPSKRQHLGL